LYILVFFQQQPDGLLYRMRKIFIISLPVVTGIMLMLVIAMPTLENIPQSIRGPIMPYALKIITVGENAYYGIPTFLQPFKYYNELFGEAGFNSGLSTLYQGYAIAGLVLWGMAASIRNTQYRPFSLTIVCLLLFIFLKSWPVTEKIFEMVPVLGSLHVTYKVLLFIHLLNIILGFKILSDTVKNQSGKGGAIIGTIMVLFGLVVVISYPSSMGGIERPIIGIISVAAGTILIFKKTGKFSSPVFGAYILTFLIVVEVFSLAFRYVPRTDPQKFFLEKGLEKYSKTLPAKARFAVYEELLSTLPNAPSPVQ